MFELVLVNATRQRTRCHIPEDLSHHHHCSASLRSSRDSDVIFCKLSFVLRCVTMLLLHITSLNFVLNWAVLVTTQSGIGTQIHGQVSRYYCVLVLSTLWSERENQQDATVRCLFLFLTISQHVSGIIMPIFRRTRRMLLHMVYSAGSAGCG